MRAYYKIVQFLRDHLESNEFVHTVMHSPVAEADIHKANIYPLAVINPVSSSLSNQNVSQFTFDIGCLDQRDISNDKVLDKFIGNDNEIDNLNGTHNILNTLVTYLKTQRNDENIQVVDMTDLQPVLYSDKNLLDGWFFSLTLQIPNTISGCK